MLIQSLGAHCSREYAIALFHCACHTTALSFSCDRRYLCPIRMWVCLCVVSLSVHANTRTLSFPHFSLSNASLCLRAFGKCAKQSDSLYLIRALVTYALSPHSLGSLFCVLKFSRCFCFNLVPLCFVLFYPRQTALSVNLDKTNMVAFACWM